VFHDPAGTRHVAQLDRMLRIGRLPDNGVALSWDDEVSRRHAHITRIGDGWALEDDASRNGSYVNGERITEPRTLRDGDVLRFGDSVVTFRAPAPAPAGAAVPLRVDEMTHVPRPTSQG
jgi:pSer/pThr/pTyr-binding forkhead associated (FHA) protein